MGIPLCILAHNEETHIQDCVRAVLKGLEPDTFKAFVYANGCTDKTAARVEELARTNSQVALRSLTIASKANAWNVAFSEHQSEFMVFSDGDVMPEKGAVLMLLAELKSKPEAVVVSSRQLPHPQGLGLEQKIVGFLQLPLLHEYLYGGLYAVRRQALVDILAAKGFTGMPAGITGEDCFLEALLAPNQLLISKCKTYYEPATFKEYFRYLARLRWQNEQRWMVYGIKPAARPTLASKFTHKVLASKDFGYLLVSVPAVVMRIGFKALFARKIGAIYQSLGPVSRDGASVLNSLTRSNSTK